MWIYLAEPCTDSTSSQESEESQKPWKGTSDQSPTVKTIDTHKPFFYPEWQKENCQTPQSGMTCEHSWDQCFLCHPILSTAAFLARTSVSQDMARAWRESEADYFSRSPGSLASYDRDSCSWRTFQRLLFEDQSELLANFAGWGMTVAGVFYPLQMWARITDAKDGGSWRGPRVGGQEAYYTRAKRKGHKIAMSYLESAVDYHESKKLFPTPTAQDAKNNGAPSQMQRNTKPLNAEIGGSLNPTWVEWLMGYPSEWTVLKDWATQWYRPKRAKRLKD